MSQMDRRMFVLNAGAVAASMGAVDPTLAHAEPNKPTPLADPTVRLNMQFREFYKSNRDELMPTTPLAGLMLIGTGEVWRLEFGVPVRSYPPAPWLVDVKGLMHGVIATQATAARLVRSRDLKSAQADAGRLAESLKTAEALIPGSLPKEIVSSAITVMQTLRGLAEGWVAGETPTAESFAAALKKVHPDLEKVLTTVGEAVYESIVAGLRQFAAESDPQEWNRCLIGVCGVGFARRDSIEIAAGIEVMGREAVGIRLLYLENAFTIADGAKQLAASIADLELGRDVFGDPYRMWRDLLGDVAAQHAGGSFFPELGPHR